MKRPTDCKVIRLPVGWPCASIVVLAGVLALGASGCASDGTTPSRDGSLHGDAGSRANPDAEPEDALAVDAGLPADSGASLACTGAGCATIVVDYASERGTFNPYLFTTLTSPIYYAPGFAMAADAGFRLIEVLVPIRALANPDDPSQYDFTRVDTQMDAVYASGAEPLAWMLDSAKTKPADLDKYARMIEHVVRHLTERWPVKVFRFGNEPDNQAFWTGSDEDYFLTFATWARTLAAMDAAFELDGPGIQRATDSEGRLSAWARNFLDYCTTNQVPVDYFSIHQYGALPYGSFSTPFKAVYDALRPYTNLSPHFGVPRLASDEWNVLVGDLWSGSYHEQFDTSWVAAHNMVAIADMIDQGLELSVRYGGPFNPPTADAPDGHDFPMTDGRGEGKPVFFAFQAFNRLADTMRIAATGGHAMNLGVLAGKRDDEVVLVISSFDAETYMDTYETSGNASAIARAQYDSYVSSFGAPPVYRSFSVSLNNLPWTSEQTIMVERFSVDDEKKLELTNTQHFAGGPTLSLGGEAPAPSVQLVVVRRAD